MGLVRPIGYAVAVVVCTIGGVFSVEAAASEDDSPGSDVRARADTPGTAARMAVKQTGASAESTAHGAAQFALATELIAADDSGAAVDALLTLVDAHPTSSLADDALFAAAQLCEQQLADPARALALYEQLGRDYATSRTSLAASRRAKVLRDEMGADGKWAQPLARYTRIVQTYATTAVAQSLVAMEALISTYPEWTGQPRARLWLGRAYERHGDNASATAHYAALISISPKTHEAFLAQLHLGDMAVASGVFDKAAHHYGNIRVEGKPTRARALRYALTSLNTARRRAAAYQLAPIVIGALLIALMLSLRHGAASWCAAGAALRAVPFEVIYYVPVVAVLVIAAFTDYVMAAPAILMIAGGGAMFAWVSGVGLRATYATRGQVELWRASAHWIAVIVGMVCVVYIALYCTGLIDFVLETIKFGPSRH